MNNSKIIDGEELKGKIGAFTQYLIDKEKSNSTIEGYRRNVKRFIEFILIIEFYDFLNGVIYIYGIIYLLVNEIFHVALRRVVNGKSKYRSKRICGV